MTKISRREFINGAAVVVGTATMVSSSALLTGCAENGARQAALYPPSWTGMRGTTEPVRIAAHEISWEGQVRWPIPEEQTDQTYDLVVVGGGITGLAAAWYFRQTTGPDTRILIIENHDDFGGHARRNEFTVEGKQLLAPGGSEFIAGLPGWPKVSRDFLSGLGIDVERLRSYCDKHFAKRHNLRQGIMLPKEGAESWDIVLDPFVAKAGLYGQTLPPLDEDAYINSIRELGLSEHALGELRELKFRPPPIYPGLTESERMERLSQISYADYLSKELGISDELVQFFGMGNFGMISHAADKAASSLSGGLPGLGELFDNHGMPVTKEQMDAAGDAGLFDHWFPDGNASIARMAVRNLIPTVAPGNTMEDIVLAQFDYGRLDLAGNSTRIRLNSTVVDVQHTADKGAVDITYVRAGAPERVRAKHTILACWNNIIPHICKEMPERQAEAARYGEKFGLVYINVALRNWQAIAKSGFGNIQDPSPDALIGNIGLLDPVDIGGYKSPSSPEDPIILRGMALGFDGTQATSRDRIRIGRHKLYAPTFEDYEDSLKSLLNRAWGRFGYSDDLISAITVNRWPHGPSYTYSNLEDGPVWGQEGGAYVVARERIGRISISNCDATSSNTIQTGIERSYQAVQEQLSV